MQHACHTDPCAKAFRVSSDGGHRLGGGAEQQSIDRLLIPESDTGDLGWQGEDQVEVFHRQQVFGPCRHPIACGGPLTFRAVPVFARVVRDVVVITFSASRHMPAERLGPAGLNGGHRFELAETDMSSIGPPPRRAVHAKDVSDLQRVF